MVKTAHGFTGHQLGQLKETGIILKFAQSLVQYLTLDIGYVWPVFLTTWSQISKSKHLERVRERGER